MTALGCKVILEYPGAVAYGKPYLEFRVQTLTDGRPVSTGGGSHIGFFANSKVQIDVFHVVASAIGANDEGASGPRPLCNEPCYGCPVRNSDGHKVEASYWDMSQDFDVHNHTH